MSVHAIAAAFDLEFKPTTKLVLICLADMAAIHEEGDPPVCWPSIPFIAKRCCMGERTVIRSLKELELAGIITKEVRHNKSTRYRLMVPICHSSPAKLAGAKLAPRNNNIIPTLYKEGNVKETEVILADFEIWWEAWPPCGRKGKKAAFKKYEKAWKEAGGDRLLRALRLYVDSVKDKKFLCHPSTWLNQGRYDDEYGDNRSDFERWAAASGEGDGEELCDEDARGLPTRH